jgi:hexosaminidase
MKNLLIGFVSVILVACTVEKPDQNTPTAILDNAAKMSVAYQVLSNTAEMDCDRDTADGFCYASELQLNFSQALPKDGWHILFSHLSPIQASDSPFFKVEHINGDLHRLTATQDINAGHTYNIQLISAFWSVAKSDVLPNYFFVYDTNKTALIKATQEQFEPNTALPTLPHAGSFTSAEQTKRNLQDKSQVTTAQSLYQHNRAMFEDNTQAKHNWLVTPSLKQKTLTDEILSIENGLAISKSNKSSYNSAWQLIKKSGVSFSEKGVPVTIDLNLETSQESIQGYKLQVQPNKINISASQNIGVFYALMTLKQLITAKQTLPIGTYQDSPRYEFRGVHLDVARNFRSVEFIKTLIKQMAQWKLNKLHLHLADDEGWRLAIDGLEELTEVGAFRCFDPTETECLLPQLGSGPSRKSKANGYYKRQDYRDILQFAASHYVEIIPSLDMPGHSRAAIKAMQARFNKLMKTEQSDAAYQYLLTDFDDKTQYSSVQHYNDNTLNPCLPSTYTFVEKVLNDLIQQHVEAGIPIKRYHIGADETAGAWHDSPVCKTLLADNKELDSIEQLGGYFVSRVAQMVQDKGIIAGGWSDGMSEFKPNVDVPMQVNVWDALMWQGHKASADFSNQGWRTILSYPDVLYFDFPYAVDPDEPGYYWASRATDSYKVFQFMPDTPSENARLWLDRQGQAYTAQPIANPKAGFEGIQAHLWSEIVRHDSVAEYMYFPRLISFAQKAWSKSEWENQSTSLSNQQLSQQINADWHSFSHLLVSKHLPLLSSQGIQFRLPPPGAIYQNGLLKMNHLYVGMQLEYQLINGEWVTYQQPISVSGVSLVRARLPERLNKITDNSQNVSAEIEL